MRFGKDVLLEIVAIVQDGLVNGTDVSEKLRAIDVEATPTENETGPVVNEVTLSDEYKSRK